LKAALDSMTVHDAGGLADLAAGSLILR